MKTFFKRLKQKWNRWLERMAKSNQELSGGGRLNCCDLNKAPGQTGNSRES